MQIDPAALSRTDSASNPAKSAAQNTSSAMKSSRALISVPRLDLEHAYTDLKAAIGDKWAEYKESTALFLLGMRVNAHDFSNKRAPARPPRGKSRRIGANLADLLTSYRI